MSRKTDLFHGKSIKRFRHDALTRAFAGALSATVVVAGIPTVSYADVLSLDSEEPVLTAEEQVEGLADLVPDGATAYLRADLGAIKEAASNSLDVDIEGGLSLGEPFVVYDVSAGSQDEIYKYPIVDEATGEVILVANVMGTTEGWSYDLSKDMADELNEVDYLNDPCIFYGEGGAVVADDSEEEVILEGDATPAMESFSEQSFEDKVDAVEEQFENMQPTDIQAVQEEAGSDVKAGYTPKLISGYNAKSVELYKKKGQGKKNLCWAATAATIINYRKGSNVTAKNVADKMNISYSTGATLAQTKSALQTYGCKSYDYTKNKQISYQKTKTNIAKKKPLCLFGSPSKGSLGHMVTIYGYDNSQGYKYLMIWNSALENGDGEYQLVKYKTDGTTFTSGGSITYTWTGSLYAENETDSSL